VLVSRRLSAVVAASLLALALVAVPSAEAAGSPAEAPAPPGRVSGVRVVEVVKPAETYEVTVDWQASTATSA